MPPSLTLTWCPSTPTPTMALQAAAKTSMLHHHRRHQPKIKEEMSIRILATLHLTLVPNCIHFLDTNVKPPKKVHKPKAKGKPSPESKHCLAPQKSLDIQMFAKELVQPPCSGALLLPAGRVGNCWSPLWPHQPAGNHGNHGNCSPMSQNSSYPTVLPSLNPNFGSYPRKSLVRRSNNEDLLA